MVDYCESDWICRRSRIVNYFDKGGKTSCDPGDVPCDHCQRRRDQPQLRYVPVTRIEEPRWVLQLLTGIKRKKKSCTLSLLRDACAGQVI